MEYISPSYSFIIISVCFTNKTQIGVGGGQLLYELPGCVCQESENVPILNVISSWLNIPILKGSGHQHNVHSILKVL